jgi:hypothetical protein
VFVNPLLGISVREEPIILWLSFLKLINREQPMTNTVSPTKTSAPISSFPRSYVPTQALAVRSVHPLDATKLAAPCAESLAQPTPRKQRTARASALLQMPVTILQLIPVA